MGVSDRNNIWSYRERSEVTWTQEEPTREEWMHDEPTFPETPDALRAWLRDSEEGNDLLRVAAKDFLEDTCRRCERRQPYPRVLAVARRLGPRLGVEVFYEEGVTVRCEELLGSQDNKAMEILCEDLLRAQLPKSWKHLVDCRSDSRVFTGLTAGRQIESLETLWILKELKLCKPEQPALVRRLARG